MIDYAKTRAWTSGDVLHTYTEKDVILYALGLGAGIDPIDATSLRFTYEKGLRVLPSMAAVLASPGPWMRERTELGIDFLKLVHGEQSVVIHSPLAAAAMLIGKSRVVRIVDKGEGKGAVLHVQKILSDAHSGRLVATAEQVLFLRGDGGFSKQGGGDVGDPSPPPLPESMPDVTLDLISRPESALIYRLSGDLNPLHVDPEVAAQAGFARPILHGLATFGMACHGLVRRFCNGDPARLKSIRVRLSSPVYPGETIRLEAWYSDGKSIAFRCRVVERDVIVLTNGTAQIEQ